ncbi:MFS transporter [Arthrobacter sp. TB 23]|uniref:MFS transporter n=1 Tax=Arthrobacter sp. TB 23 TaxID=494419 RepID=UPI00055B13B3|nr:MFS transporter [Arthrobacter sp. TB 23]
MMRFTLVSVLLHAFFLQLAVALIRPTTSYIALDLGATAVSLAWVVASFSVLPIVLAFPLGRMLDIGKEKPVLVVGALLMLATGPGLIFAAPNLTALSFWCTLLGLGHLMSLLSEQKRIAAGTVDHNRIFGIYTTSAAAAQLLGPFLLGFIGGRSVTPDTTALLVGYCAIVFSLLLVSLLMLRHPVVPSLASRSPGGGIRRAFVTRPGVKGGLAASILISMLVLCAIDLLQVYLPALAVERGMAVSEVGLLLAFRAAGTLVCRFGLGWLVYTIGRNRILVVSSGIAAALLALVVVPMPLVSALVLMFCLGLMLGIGQPLSMAMMSSYAPSDHLGTWLALRLTGSRAGQVLIPIGLSTFTIGAGAGGVLTGTACLLLLSSLGSIRPLARLERNET